MRDVIDFLDDAIPAWRPLIWMVATFAAVAACQWLAAVGGFD